MKKTILPFIIFLFLGVSLTAQISAPKFGKGIQFLGQDSSYYLKFGLRFQSLIDNEWNIHQEGETPASPFKSKTLIRRARLKFNGWILDPKLQYKFQIGLTNRDEGGGVSNEFNKAANIVFDAYVDWNFHRNLSIQFGQALLFGNRGRNISSANLQFVDRSILNEKFNLDRDVGFQIKNHHLIGKHFLMREIFAFSQGEGRNVTAGHFGGYDYTFRVEALPFGEFQSKGDYIGSDLKQESSPKLAFGFTYDINDFAVRERGQLGRFIQDENGVYYGEALHTFFADMIFKYRGVSMMMEYVNRSAADGSSIIQGSRGEVVGTFYTGSALNTQAGYLFDNNWEVAARYTVLRPHTGIAFSENRYTFGLSKYIISHKFKIQTDFTYKEIAFRDDKFTWRMQMEVHF